MEKSAHAPKSAELASKVSSLAAGLNLNPDSSCIILFIKAPIEGQVKTRLADAMGPVHAVNIYKCFIKDMINTAIQTGFQLKLFYYPSDSKPFIKNWLDQEFDYCVQTGSNLGEKMSTAFQNVFNEKLDRAVLIGSDIPDLPESYIREAINRLDVNDAVIGPASDGGYYLIGFRSDSFHPDIFKNISWSTNTVYAATCNKFKKLRFNFHVLPKWRDVDTYADLMDLADSLLNFRSSANETSKYLIQNRASMIPKSHLPPAKPVA